MLLPSSVYGAYILFLMLIMVNLCSPPVLSDGSKKDKAKNVSPMKKEEMKSAILPPCQLCKTLVDSFRKGMEKTARSNFQGGDTAWEEEKLKGYATSEVRFIEIQEMLCKDVEKGNSQCLSLAEEFEHKLEEWWFQHFQKTNIELQHWLCVDTLKHCCPADHYGPLCQPCPGLPGNVCNNNGKCRGAGTRRGNGTCNCDEGYKGMLCDTCAPSYYESYRDESKMLCSKCHLSCNGGCTQAGPKGCEACNPGWSHDLQRGCVDVNECLFDGNGKYDSPCERNHFCVNNEGSYTCLACDKSCDGCQGDGPDMCDTCAKGFVGEDGLCVDDKDVDGWGRMDTSRYLTYLGLCIATCIIFQKNTIIASLVGLSVAVYVTVSEYMLGAGRISQDAIQF